MRVPHETGADPPPSITAKSQRQPSYKRFLAHMYNPLTAGEIRMRLFKMKKYSHCVAHHVHECATQ